MEDSGETDLAIFLLKLDNAEIWKPPKRGLVEKRLQKRLSLVKERIFVIFKDISFLEYSLPISI